MASGFLPPRGLAELEFWAQPRSMELVNLSAKVLLAGATLIAGLILVVDIWVRAERSRKRK